jgi:hypothetical protein
MGRKEGGERERERGRKEREYMNTFRAQLDMNL